MTAAESTFNGPFVITGLSGAGKTLLSRSLEDIGYLCVDNIPLELVPLLFARTEEEKDRLVVVLDVRTRGMIQLFPEFFKELRSTYPGVRLVFVEASPNLSPHDLRRQVQTLGGDDDRRSRLTIEVQSFSYMQGVPATASLVFDVRFLPNPFFVQELRALSGDDDAVKTWLDAYPEVEEAVSRIMDLVSFLLPRYVKEMKTHLGIALGCTGGKHRSVYAAERVARELAGAGHEVVVHHRDKERWRYSS